MANQKIPTYGEISSLYLDGMTQEEIIQLYEADIVQMDVRSRKRDTKFKIIHFFKVIEGSKKAYIEHPRARIDKANLLFYANKKTSIPTTSIKKVLEALEKQGWSLQEATRDMELLCRSLKRRN
ncbi:MAG: hypothetical protein EHM20_03810 [Alphaproteobacteria bacterium]|nr:MAG: hypothetical protein EHM20_03810 [Alphaproteobacteria bacterium]